MIIAGTSHRPDKLGGYDNDTLNKLIAIAREYMRENVVTKVISGMALGWDMAFAIAALKEGLPLECAVPFKGQESVWSEESKKIFNYILSEADEITYVCDEGYESWKMQTRNEYMVDKCDILVAMWDGSEKGGTWNCVKYAMSKKRRMVNLFKKL